VTAYIKFPSGSLVRDGPGITQPPIAKRDIFSILWSLSHTTTDSREQAIPSALASLSLKIGWLVVGWETTSESQLLYVLIFGPDALPAGFLWEFATARYHDPQ